MLQLEMGEGTEQSRWKKHLNDQSQYTEHEIPVLSSSSFWWPPNSSFIFLGKYFLWEALLRICLAYYLQYFLPWIRQNVLLPKGMQDCESHILGMLNTRIYLPFYWCCFKCSVCIHQCGLWYIWLCHDNQVLTNLCLQNIEMVIFLTKIYLLNDLLMCYFSGSLKSRKNIVCVSSSPLQQILFP